MEYQSLFGQQPYQYDVSLILEGYIHFLESEDGGEDEKEIQHGGSNLDS